MIPSSRSTPQAELTRCASRFRRREPILGGSRARAFPPRRKSVRFATRQVPLRYFRRGAHARADASLARAHRVSAPRRQGSVHLSTQGVASAAQGRGHRLIAPAPPLCRRPHSRPPRAPVTSVCVAALAPRLRRGPGDPIGNPPRASPGNHPRRNRRSPRARAPPRHA